MIFKIKTPSAAGLGFDIRKNPDPLPERGKEGKEFVSRQIHILASVYLCPEKRSTRVPTEILFVIIPERKHVAVAERLSDNLESQR